jgi:hypothetical protein
VRCVICLKQGEWPSREEDVEEVDVDKLKEMVHVDDAHGDAAAIPADNRGPACEDAQGVAVRLHDHGLIILPVAALHALDPHDATATWGLLMLALIVVAIMLGYPPRSR